MRVDGDEVRVLYLAQEGCYWDSFNSFFFEESRNINTGDHLLHFGVRVIINKYLTISRLKVHYFKHILIHTWIGLLLSLILILKLHGLLLLLIISVHHHSLSTNRHWLISLLSIKRHLSLSTLNLLRVNGGTRYSLVLVLEIEIMHYCVLLLELWDNKLLLWLLKSLHLLYTLLLMKS